jgi:hypothetical protein
VGNHPIDASKTKKAVVLREDHARRNRFPAF